MVTGFRRSSSPIDIGGRRAGDDKVLRGRRRRAPCAGQCPPTSPPALGLKPYSHWGWRPEDGNVMRKNDYTTLRVRARPARSVPAHRSLCGSPVWSGRPSAVARPTALQADGHRRRHGERSWHTDRYYWQTCSSEDMLTAWMPFADVSGADGAMSMVDGGHRWTDQLGTNGRARHSRLSTPSWPNEKRPWSR